jgi:hypothetical protein
MSIETDAISTAVKTVASPVLHYVYGAIIALLIGGFVTYTIHERNVGEAKIVALDKAHSAELAKKDQTIADTAQLQLIDVGTHEKIALAAPPIADTGLVCVAPSNTPAPAAAESNSESGQVEQLSSGSFDPSGQLLTLLRDDDTRINDLVGTVNILTDYIAKLTATNK